MDFGVVWEWTWKVCFIYYDCICYGLLNEFGTNVQSFYVMFLYIYICSFRMKCLLVYFTCLVLLQCLGRGRGRAAGAAEGHYTR